MAWKDLTNRAKDWVREKGASLFASHDKPYSELGNGGASGYYPEVAARQERTQRLAALREEAANQRAQARASLEAQAGHTAVFHPMHGDHAQQGMQQGYTQQFPQQGMQQGYTQQFPQQDMQQGYTQQFPQQDMQQGYTQLFPQQDMMQAGYTQQFQRQGYAQTGYSPSAQPQMQQGYVSFGQPQQGYAPAYGAPNGFAPEGQAPVPDNISFMPGAFVDNDARAYAHVERVTQLVSFQACYRIIEFMKNGESVIVNTESIPNETEVIRCIDMLSGAAYTLGCSITKITNIKRAYLIAPPTVQVLADSLIKRMSERRGEESTSRRRSSRYAAEDYDRGYGAQESFFAYEEPERMAVGYTGNTGAAGAYGYGEDAARNSAYAGARSASAGRGFAAYAR